MPDTVIDSALTGKLDATLLLKWLNNESLEDTPEDCILHCCNRNEFVTCFLSYLRNQTDSILQTNSNAVQILQHSTPEKLLSTRRKHRRSISDPTSDDRTMDSLTVKTDRQRSHESPSKDRKRTGRRVKTKLFNEDKNLSNQSVSSDESRLSTGLDRITLTSTPMKNGLKPADYPNLSLSSPVTPRSFVKEQHERCDTPRLSHRHSRSQDKSCLGDYLVNATKSSKKKKSGRSSTDNEDSKVDLDLSNSEMFPAIGARKSSSLRSEKRRIKPTNIDKSQKSISLNSFSTESIQTSPLLVEENSAFKQQRIQVKETNNFETERNILKQERHKLMEKFNILNTSSTQKVVSTPQIKITQKSSIEKCYNYIKSDNLKVTFKEKLDFLVEVYELLFKNNLIMSVNTEIYFLISILISKQYEDDYLAAESKLNGEDMNFLLKTIHNSTYFAVKSLWHQRLILEVVLDKSSLKTLGENKKVRSFYPDLAKFLLNCYGLRCEAESNLERKQDVQSNGVICFNMETDNVDNFPSMLSFHNFKKQRDMFYEILRWYQDTSPTGISRSSFRSRVKALLCSSSSPTNHAHLATLLTRHMLAHCLPKDKQESKLSKLQRRLTCPTAPESHRLPHFTAQEMFYKEFIINAENESFRVHLRDALATEIITLDSTQIASDDRATNLDITKEYLPLSKKLGLLAKFLGYLASLPYSLVIDVTNKNAMTKTIQTNMNYTTPKEKVLENDVSLRNYSQPTIDLQGILNNAIETSRLAITIPWIVHYLSMLDYTALRIKYYQNILKILFDIYTNRLKLIDTNRYFKKNTIIYLKSILGWLFDLPHFPQELFYENRLSNNLGIDLSIDSCDLVDESSLIELCPHLKDLNVLLSSCRVSQEQKEMGTYRHITPVSLTLNSEDRIKNKEKELQTRLEEEFLKSQPSSTRRVLEVVIERITSAVIRELSATVLLEARQRGSTSAALALSTCTNQATAIEQVESIYHFELTRLRTVALETARTSISSRAQGAVTSLLSNATPPLVALVVKAAVTRLNKWINDHWNSTAILCKDIEAEVKTYLALGDLALTAANKQTADVTTMTLPQQQFDKLNVSVATCIINLKEQVCILLSGGSPAELTGVLSASARACAPGNVLARAAATRALLQLSVDLCVVYVSRKPSEVTEQFLNKLHAIWNVCCPDRKRTPSQDLTLPDRREELSPELRNFDEEETIHTPISDDEGPPITNIIIKNDFSGVKNDSNSLSSKSIKNGPLSPNTIKIQNATKNVSNLSQNTKNVSNLSQNSKNVSNLTTDENDNDENLEFFDRILCPRNIMLLSMNKCVEAWEAMATVLVFLLTNDYLNEDSLTEQCLAVYRQDWPQNVLESLSRCMRSVSARWSRSAAGKFTLFLDFLAEYCGDMDLEPLDPSLTC